MQASRAFNAGDARQRDGEDASAGIVLAPTTNGPVLGPR